jgi:Transposase DDE domain
VTNWPAYDAALRQRGSLTMWFSDAAIAAWCAEPRTSWGGRPHYSAVAIATALTLSAVFRQPLKKEKKKAQGRSVAEQLAYVAKWVAEERAASEATRRGGQSWR